MPVLVTLTVANLLFGGSDDEVSLLSPASLRPKLNDVLVDKERQRYAIVLLERLEKSVADYNKSVVSEMDDFAKKMKRDYLSMPAMASRFSRLDAERQDVFNEVVFVRRQLLKLLGPDEWRALFDT